MSQIEITFLILFIFFLFVSLCLGSYLIFKKTSIKNLDEMSNEIKQISNLLVRTNKVAKAGEYLLERILNNISFVNKKNGIVFRRQYELQKTDSDGGRLIADMMILGNNKFCNIPVDSKFSVMSYQDYINESDPTLKTIKLDNFIKYTKDRITEVTKYISERDNTRIGIMFVPSETIFDEIVSLQIKNTSDSLLDIAFKKNIIISSPSTLTAILSSIDYYLEMLSNFEDMDKKLEKLNLVMKGIDNYDKSSLIDMKKAAEKVIEAIDDISKKEKTLMNRFNNLVKEN